MAPIVHGLEVEYYGRVLFSFLDTGDPATTDFQRTLGSSYHPEFYLLDPQGNVLQKWFGYVEADTFRAAFDSYQ
ncbi:hypothetical protein ACFLXB_01785 [Chloroflexota bacterium]